MRVIRRAANYRIQILLIQHPPKIPKTFGVGILFAGGGEIFQIHIAQGRDVGFFYRGDPAQITAAPTGNTHDADVKFFIDPKHFPHVRERHGSAGDLKKGAAVCLFHLISRR